MKIKKKLYLFSSVFLVLCLCVSVSIAAAAEFRQAKNGESVMVSGNERPRNLYAGGNIVNVEGNVTEDMISAGSVININGDISDDLWLAGGTVVIQGNVGGSLRVMGGNILINGQINEDVFIAGGNITLSKSASVGGDVIIAGGIVNIESVVNGNINVATGGLTLNRQVGGTVNSKTGKFLNLGSDAVIAGDLIYQAPKEIKLDNGARVFGEMKFTEKTFSGNWGIKDSFKGMFGLLIGAKFLLHLISLIVLGMILVYLFNGITEKITLNGLKRFWPNFGLGLIALILAPIVLIILLISIIGVKLAFIIGLIYSLFILITTGLGSVIAGVWLRKVLWKQNKYSVDWQAVLLGAAVFSALDIIPVIGWLASLVFILLAFGALCQFSYQGLVSVKKLK